MEIENHLTQLVIQKQEELLKKVVEMCTRKPFEIEDAKRCTIVHHPDLERPDYYFAFDGLIVGTVKHAFSGASFEVKFIPHERPYQRLTS